MNKKTQQASESLCYLKNSSHVDERKNLRVARPPPCALNGTDSTFNDYLLKIGKVHLQNKLQLRFVAVR